MDNKLTICFCFLLWFFLKEKGVERVFKKRKKRERGGRGEDYIGTRKIFDFLTKIEKVENSPRRVDVVISLVSASVLCQNDMTTMTSPPLPLLISLPFLVLFFLLLLIRLTSNFKISKKIQTV
jgi:hypothetical protein